MKNHITLNVQDHVVRGYEHQIDTDHVIVFLHGYTGNKTENNRLFYHLSEDITKQGYSTIRMDWLGHGESDLLFSELTVDLLLQQGNTVLKYAKSRYKHVTLLGFSMGGALSMQLVDDTIDSLILMAPAYQMGGTKLGGFIDPTQTMKDLGGITLSKTFAQGLAALNNLDTILQYHGPVLLLQGDHDLAVSIQSTIELHQLLPKSTLHLFKDATHCFQSVRDHNLLSNKIVQFLQKEC